MIPGVLLQYNQDAWITGTSQYPGIGDTSVNYGANGSGTLSSGTGVPALFTILRNSGVSKGRFGVRQFQFEPHLFLDTRFVPFPYVIRLEMVARVEHIADTAEVIYGVGSWKDDVDIVASLSLIGFRCRNGGNWRATVKDEAIVWLDVDTGVASVGTYHHLRVDINGQTRTITFYIDNSVVGSFQFVAPNNLGVFGSGFDMPPVSAAVWNEIVPTGGGRIVIAPGFRPAVSLLTPEAAGAGPDKPVISVADTGPQFVDLAGSAYSHPDSVAHRMSIWQIDELGGDFSTPIKEIVDTPPSSLVAHRISGLSLLTTYFARVLYIDANFVASPWSDAIAFSTDASDFTCGDAPATAYTCADP